MPGGDPRPANPFRPIIPDFRVLVYLPQSDGTICAFAANIGAPAPYNVS